MDSEKKIFNYDSDEPGHLGLPTGTFYGDDGNYLSAPSNVATGHAPLDSLPASWWNYLWHYICDVQNCFYQDVDGVFEEIINAIKLGYPDIVFDPYDHTQLYKAIEHMTKAVATDETRGTIVSSDEYGKVSVDPETGIATANGVGDLTQIDPLFQPSTTLVQAFNKVVSIIKGYAPLYHPSEDRTEYGEGTDKLYGHTKLTDEIPLTYDSSKEPDEEPNSSILKAEDSVGISPLAVSKIYSEMYNNLLKIARTSLPYSNMIISSSMTIEVSSATNYCIVTSSDITVTVPKLEADTNGNIGGIIELYYTPTTSRKYATVKVPTSSSATENHVLCRLRNHFTLYSDSSGYWHVPIEQQYTSVIARSNGEQTSDAGFGPCFVTVANKTYRMSTTTNDARQFFCFDGITLDYISRSGISNDDSAQQTFVNNCVSNYPGHLLVCITSCRPYPPSWCSSGFGPGYGIYPQRAGSSRYGWTLIAQQGLNHSQIATWLGNSDGENNEITVPWRWGVDQNNNASWGMCGVQTS